MMEYYWNVRNNIGLYISEEVCYRIYANRIFRFITWAKALIYNTTYEYLISAYWRQRLEVCKCIQNNIIVGKEIQQYRKKHGLK